MSGCVSVNVGRSGCLTVTVQRCGGISCVADRLGGISVVVGLVCTVNIGDAGIIWASDGRLITLEGGYLIGVTE